MGKVEKLPQVYKEEELKMMIELVEAGLWKNSNLARILNVVDETIADWKKRPEVLTVYRKVVLQTARKRMDVEKRLRELAVESDPEVTKVVSDGVINVKIHDYGSGHQPSTQTTGSDL